MFEQVRRFITGIRWQCLVCHPVIINYAYLIPAHAVTSVIYAGVSLEFTGRWLSVDHHHHHHRQLL